MLFPDIGIASGFNFRIIFTAFFILWIFLISEVAEMLPQSWQIHHKRIPLRFSSAIDFEMVSNWYQFLYVHRHSTAAPWKAFLLPKVPCLWPLAIRCMARSRKKVWTYLTFSAMNANTGNLLIAHRQHQTCTLDERTSTDSPTCS